MKVLKSWAHALGIDQGTMSTWMKEAPKHANFTFWCLDRGHLRSSDYFAWAMNHYGLAMIKEDYFSLPANRDLWMKIQSVANWGPEMLPLEEWDGTVFIACVEPDPEIQWSFPVQYVLASTRDLHTQWERLHSEATVAGLSMISEPPTPSVPESLTKTINLMSPAMALPEDEQPPAQDPATIKALEDADTAPKIPQTLMPPPLQTNVVGRSPSVATPAPVLVVPPPPPQAFEEVDEVIVTDDEPLAIPPMLTVDDEPLEETPPAPVADASTLRPKMTPVQLEDSPPPIEASAPINEAQIDEPIGLSLKPKASGFKLSLGGHDPEPPAESEDSTAVNTPASAQSDVTATHSVTPLESIHPNMTASVPNLAVPISVPLKHTTGHGPIDADRLAPASLAAAKSEMEAIAFVFQQLKQSFKYSWLFFVSGNQLVPYCWESSVKPVATIATEPVDLTQPSLFRIVMRTRMPYHGHVVESPINTGFFRNWGLRNTPPHATAIPLTSAGATIAILLCAGDKPTQQDQTLRFTEKMGLSILSSFGKKQAA